MSRYQTFRIAVPANDTQQINFNGNFIRCLEANKLFKIAFDDENPAEFMQGLSYDSDAAFRKIRVINEGAGTLNLLLAVGVGRLLDGRLTTTAALDIASIPELVLADGNKITVEPIKLGTSRAVLDYTTSGMTQVVAPALNTNGIVLRTGNIATRNNTGILLAHTSTPAGMFDGWVILLARVLDSAAYSSDRLESELLIPAGYGIYLTRTVNDMCFCALTYDIL